MFPQLQEPKFRLPVSAQTIENLKQLAVAMAEPATDQANEDSDIPAAYTYLGQFIDHDVSKIETLPGFEIKSLRAAALLGPMSDPLKQHENQRLAPLDLDSLYTKAAEDQGNTGKLRLGPVATVGRRPPGKDDFNDLPRNETSPDINFDRAAQIGDPRNDENLIVAQLHVAFLRAHNALVVQLGDRLKARAALTELYLDIIFTDFLPRVADLAVLNRVLANGRSVWNPASLGDVPLEHAGAAYRFGHSMVRATYDYNLNFGIGGAQSGGQRTPFRLLFTFTALSGQLATQPTLPENWIIDWNRIAVSEKARKIDTFVTPAMNALTDTLGQQFTDGMNILAERNLLRGLCVWVADGAGGRGGHPGGAGAARSGPARCTAHAHAESCRRAFQGCFAAVVLCPRRGGGVQGQARRGRLDHRRGDAACLGRGDQGPSAFRRNHRPLRQADRSAETVGQLPLRPAGRWHRATAQTALRPGPVRRRLPHPAKRPALTSGCHRASISCATAICSCRASH